MRRIPIRPATTGSNGEFPADIVVAELHRTHGEVIDARDIARFATEFGVRERYVRDALGIHTELGLLVQPRRDLWLPASCAVSNADAVRAHAASRILGPWCHPIGIWTMLLRGWIDALPPDAIRACASPHPSKPRTQHRANTDSGCPIPTARRHVTCILDEPVAVVARPWDALTNCDWIDDTRPEALVPLGVHIERAADALVTMLEHPRLNGGVDVALALVVQVIHAEGLQAILDAARRTRFTSTRRRVAFVLAHAQRTDPDLDRLIMRDPRVAPHTLDAWLDDWIPRLLLVAATSRPTLLDPHKLRAGPVALRFGLVDNRGAPLQERRVTMPVDDPATARPMLRPTTSVDAREHSGDLRK